MNSEKTGAFIASLRKERELTQQQLADKLHVTFQAVSRWERGHGLPDISLLPALAQTFDISINELLAGEIMEQIDKQVADTITTTTAKAYSKQTRSRILRRLYIAIPAVVLVAVLLLFTIGQISKAGLPSFTGISTRIVAARYLRALEQHDIETLGRLLPPASPMLLANAERYAASSNPNYDQLVRLQRMASSQFYCNLAKNLWEIDGIAIVSHSFEGYGFDGTDITVRFLVTAQQGDITLTSLVFFAVRNGQIYHISSERPHGSENATAALSEEQHLLVLAVNGLFHF